MSLDRALMLRKHIPDIRLLRSREPRVAAQMLDLAPYLPASSMPPARRDLSVAMPDGVDAETLSAAMFLTSGQTTARNYKRHELRPMRARQRW